MSSGSENSDGEGSFAAANGGNGYSRDLNLFDSDGRIIISATYNSEQNVTEVSKMVSFDVDTPATSPARLSICLNLCNLVCCCAGSSIVT